MTGIWMKNSSTEWHYLKNLILVFSKKKLGLTNNVGLTFSVDDTAQSGIEQDK